MIFDRRRDGISADLKPGLAVIGLPIEILHYNRIQQNSKRRTGGLMKEFLMRFAEQYEFTLLF